MRLLTFISGIAVTAVLGLSVPMLDRYSIQQHNGNYSEFHECHEILNSRQGSARAS